MSFEIGEKVKWLIGREDRLILNRALFLEETENGFCEVMLYESKGLECKRKISTLTSNLSKDV